MEHQSEICSNEISPSSSPSESDEISTSCNQNETSENTETSTSCNQNENETNEKKPPIILKPYQIEHYDRICDSVTKYHGYLDTSPTGLGKTPVTLKLSKEYEFDGVGVIAPLSVTNVWREESEKYGVKIKFNITYQALRGTAISPPKHGLLERVGDEFTVTEKFRKYVKDGLLLIFDEVHNLKNDTAQLKAAHCLVKALIEMNCGSRIALLSATPCDKPIHVESILKMLGIIKSERLYSYNPSTHEYQNLGLAEVINLCRVLQPTLTDSLLKYVVIDKRTASQICYELFTQVLKPFLLSSMSRPPSPTISNNDSTEILSIEKDCKNGYYEMEPAEVEQLREGVYLLSKITKYRSETGDIYIERGAWKDITKALTIIEKAKVQLMIRLAKQTLNAHPNNKVILYFNYLPTINLACHALKEYNPLLLYGQTRVHERDHITKQFQIPTADHRLLISNVRVGGVGINLDDRTGHWPRFMFIIPNYNIIDLEQATGRIYRTSTTKSTATIRFVYSKAFPYEPSILTALYKKATVLRAITISDDKITALLPGEYPNEIENPSDTDLTPPIIVPLSPSREIITL